MSETSETRILRRTFNPHIPDTDFTTDIQPTRPRHWYYDGHSTNKAPQVIQITWHLITTVSVTKLFLRIIIIFHHNPRSLVWSWHEFKTSVAIEVGSPALATIHEQRLSLPHTVKSLTSPIVASATQASGLAPWCDLSVPKLQPHEVSTAVLFRNLGTAYHTSRRHILPLSSYSVSSQTPIGHVVAPTQGLMIWLVRAVARW